ncbi:MAG: AbrB/MazE/SpoVT family DNA-binding domain-containing protein [bacterium]|nr:AbrB/MazE/SpoVT family DNA-binding domain-containing protein [bacterium]
MEKVVQKTTSKGQITLPKAWRGQFQTTHFVLEPSNDAVVIRPIFLDDPANYKAVFSAKRDNKGKGISAKKLLRAIK